MRKEGKFLLGGQIVNVEYIEDDTEFVVTLLGSDEKWKATPRQINEKYEAVSEDSIEIKNMVKIMEYFDQIEENMKHQMLTHYPGSEGSESQEGE